MLRARGKGSCGKLLCLIYSCRSLFRKLRENLGIQEKSEVFFTEPSSDRPLAGYVG